MVNNLNDGMAWGLFPILFAASGFSIEKIGILAATYPVVWGLGQLWTGSLSDSIGRKKLIVTGMQLQAVGILLMLFVKSFGLLLVAMGLMGIGTACVYPTLIAAIGDERGKSRLQSLESLEHVERVFPILKSFKLAGRESHSHDSVIDVGPCSIGGKQFGVMAGPCSVESREQILETAHCVKEAGATILRGGAYKPRTSPYSFQGLAEEGLKFLKEASEATGLPFITEVMSPEQVPLVSEYADILQIGARNMQNYGLLTAVGRSDTPVFVKRGMMSTINEWLMSAEYPTPCQLSR